MISRQTCGPLLAIAFALLSDPARADALTSAVGARQSLNVTAILMFLGFVAVSLGITFWAARRGTRTAKRLLCGRRRPERIPERARDRRRLHFGRDVPGRHRAGLHVGL